MRKLSKSVSRFVSNFITEFFIFLSYLFVYCKKKTQRVGNNFEKQKNKLVRFFIMKRGRYNRPFLHLTTMAVLGIGVLIAPILADELPIFRSSASELTNLELAENREQSVVVGDDVFKTSISEKPRDEILTYTVQKGDTLSTIAEKFGISKDTIKWSNDLTSDTITVGDQLKILPVTGVAHKVAQGDTVYTIADKYDTEAQKIVDFPFNDFANPETFALVVGQNVIVPDGIKPSAQPVYQQKRQTYYATGPVTSVSGGGTTWPVRGGVSQFASWYHMALDITANVGTPVVAAHGGTITKVNIGSWDGGYGTNVIVDDGNGTQTLYAHMSGVNVSIGSQVAGGSTVVGWVGMTGRTTGPHLHFEIRKNGALVNPLSYLQ